MIRYCILIGIMVTTDFSYFGKVVVEIVVVTVVNCIMVINCMMIINYIMSINCMMAVIDWY